MELTKLQRVVVDALEDVKAHDIKVYNTVGLSDMFDRVVLASGTSNRQTRALAWHVAEKVKQAGGRVVSVEGADAGEWVLVDLGDVVVHIMQPTIREYYGLEEVWGSKPVRVKLFDAKPARTTEAAAANGARAKKASGKATGTAAKKKTSPSKAARPAGDAKATAKKAVPKKAAATKTTARKTAAKEPPAKQTAAKKTTPKKAAKKTSQKTAKKATPRKTAR